MTTTIQILMIFTPIMMGFIIIFIFNLIMVTLSLQSLPAWLKPRQPCDRPSHCWPRLKVNNNNNNISNNNNNNNCRSYNNSPSGGYPGEQGFDRPGEGRGDPRGDPRGGPGDPGRGPVDPRAGPDSRGGPQVKRFLATHITVC